MSGLKELVAVCDGLGIASVPAALLRDLAERQPVGLDRDPMTLLKRHGCLPSQRGVEPVALVQTSIGRLPCGAAGMRILDEALCRALRDLAPAPTA